MSRFSLLSLVLATVVGAVPFNLDAGKNVFKWTSGYNLTLDDVIVPINGVPHVMKESHYLDQLKVQGITLGAPELDPSWVTYSGSDIPDAESSERDLESRQASCDQTFSIVTDKTETFIDWDIQMSPVVCAVGEMTISVSSGYTVSNAIGGSAGVDLKWIKDRLGVSLGVDYTRTWSTVTSIDTRGPVENGKCGVMITQPIVTRRSGRQFRGCVGSTTETGTWYADSHNEGSYNGVKWVEGAVSMCKKAGSAPPLSRCNGQGNFR
ncbi:hypothetical protein AK830_g7920 [Neonectria ditissima]|uniref:Uncharacterized protein n=1 Tax=Neonectria ditissima TaxID=78410 RepID=A0A0P7BCN1_9HYPO|nr:hypothetical protein AK830_g7920 [Neonectria ditissima]